MEQLKLIPFIFLMIGVSAIIGGAVAIVLSEFGNSVTKCYNTSYSINAANNACTNNTGGQPAIGTDNLNLTDEFYVLVKGQSGIGTVANQLSTIAIISVMVIIIGLISSVFVYFKYFY